MLWEKKYIYNEVSKMYVSKEYKPHHATKKIEKSTVDGVELTE